MAAWQRLRHLFRNLLRKREVDRDLDRELNAYVEMLADEKIRRGTPADVARREARLELGGHEQVKEEVRDARAGALVEAFVQDVRYALRGLRRAPAFALTAIVTLALGIGANTAMFSVVDALLLKPIGVPEPERLVAVYRAPAGQERAFSYPEFSALAARTDLFAGASAWGSSVAWLRAGSQLDRIPLHVVSPTYFGTLRVSPRLGTFFPAANDEASRGMAVISERLWRTRFSGDQSIVGQPLTLNGQVLSIAGVVPDSFRGLSAASPTDVWVTFATLSVLEPGWSFRDAGEIWLQVVARLQDGMTREAASSALAPFAPAGPRAGAPTRPRLVSAATPIFDPEARATSRRIAALCAAVPLFVLLIAAGNLANLLLARGSARRRELGLRLAIGASKGRLVRQMMTESGLLALIGCAAGLVVAQWTIQTVVALAPRAAIPSGIAVSLDSRAILFAVLASIVVTTLFGLLPAWQAARTGALSSLQTTGAGSERTTGGSLKVRRALVLVQVALSTILLAGAGLFIRTLNATLAVEPGYDVSRVLLATVDFSAPKLEPPAARLLGDRVLQNVRAIPGVEGAAYGQVVPFSGAFVMRPAVPSDVQVDPARVDDFSVPYGVVSEGYFSTLGMPLRGRDFTATDVEDAPRVAIVNETLARRYWPGRDAIGQRFRMPLRQPGPEFEVVGVVPDGKYVTLAETQHPFVYVPWKQMHRPRVTLHVRTTGQPEALGASVRAAVAAASSELPSYNVTTLATYLEGSIATERFVSGILLTFSTIALLVAAVGAYGLTAYTVARRTKELGVRIALGASPAAVVRMLLSQSSRWIAAGLLIGTGGALALARLVETMLFGVTPADPLTFVVTGTLLAATMLLATLVPARRATRVDPLAALRND